LFVGAVGCGGGGGDEDEAREGKDKTVAGTELCGGKAVSDEASRALKVITGESRFGASAEEETTERAAAALAKTFPAPTDGKQDLCRVFTPDFELRVSWRLMEGPPTKEAVHPKFTALAMGEETLTAADTAYVQFACTSGKLSDATREGHVRVLAERWGMPTEPEGDVEALKDAYATVAHSFSLAVAKELGCEKDGGLPAQPVLDPA